MNTKLPEAEQLKLDSRYLRGTIAAQVTTVEFELFGFR